MGSTSRSAKPFPTWALPAMLVIATLVAYLPAMRGGYIWDDDFYVTANASLRGFSGLVRIWTDPSANPQYYPMTFTTLWLNHLVHGLEPFGYHLVNVLLHAASALVLARIVVRLELPGAWLAAALFALHPVHVESVAWITERKNTLSGLLYLGSMAAFLAWERGRDGRRLALSWGLFLSALLSKSVTAMLAPALVVILVWRRRRLDRRTWVQLGAMTLVGAAAGIVTAALEVHQVGAKGEDWSLGPFDRLLVAGRVVFFYLGKLAVPVDLSFSYPRWTIDAGSLIAWCWPAAAASLLAGLWALRPRIGSGPLAAYLFFLVTLFPALGFLNVYPMRYAFVADHFQYLASLGPIVLAAAAWGRLAPGTGGRVIAALALVALAATTYRQGGAYADAETCWRASLKTSPDSWLANYNLGKIVEAQGKTDEALALYRRTLELRPKHVDALNNIGNILLNGGRKDEAVATYERARGIDPTFPITRFNLGIAYEAAGRIDDALAEYGEAGRLSAGLPDRFRGGRGPLPWKAWLRRGRLLGARGDEDGAVEAFRRSAETNPESAEPLSELAGFLSDRGRVPEALEAYRAAAAREPANAVVQYNFALALEGAGDGPAAAEHYRAAIRADGSFAAAHNNLAILLYRAGDYAGAWREARESARLGLRPHPDFLRALAERMPPP